jgi:hypothetical protein
MLSDLHRDSFVPYPEQEFQNLKSHTNSYFNGLRNVYVDDVLGHTGQLTNGFSSNLTGLFTF